MNKMIKKVFIIVLILIVTLFATSKKGIVQAETNTLAEVRSTQGITVTPGYEFTTTVSLTTVQNVSGYQLGFLYDTSKFTLISIKNNPSINGDFVYNIDELGKIAVTFSNVSELMTDNISLFSLTFLPLDGLSLDYHDLLVEDPNYRQVISWIDDLGDPYAIDNLTFNLSPVRNGVFGDVNSDAKVNIIDVGYIQQYIVGLREFNSDQITLGNVNGDENLDTVDVAYIQQYIVGTRSILSGSFDPIIDDTLYPTEVTYPTGLYDYQYQTADVRHTFMAAAEKYLLDTMAGGVPVFANGGFALYSSRLQLPVENYVAVMGYGERIAAMTADDSTVLMADGEYGVAGEYTYRTTSTTNPVTWNQWLYDTSTDSDYMGLYFDAPYTYQFNDDMTGYELVPSMMESDPVPVNSYFNEYGKELSTTWQMTVRDDLSWYFHPDTDTTGFTDLTIDATDFVETYKLALANNWFRAVSGGEDFITSRMSIAGAAQFNAEPTEANWAGVGIKLIDDYTFEFTFENEQSEWNVRYFMGSFVMTPINMELYEVLGDTYDGGTYGTSNTTIAYTGPYYVDYYEADKTLVYKENPNYYDPDEYFYTGYEFQIIDDAAVRFQEFVAGKLETITLSSENYDEFANHPGLRRIPGATTFRLMINGLGDVASQQEQFLGSTYVPEPLLAVDDFKRAMYFVIDTNTLATEVLKTSQPQMYLFTDAYLVEPESGIPYRQTEQGLAVGEGLSPGTNGYNLDAGVAYWQLALDALVAEGVYAADDVISIDLFIFSGSEAQTLFGTYIKDTFEAAFDAESNEYGISVEVTITPKDFPGIYYDYMMTGNFDLSIGGISGSTLDAASFLDVFADDNRGGFTLNWGIDTSTANIPVKYVTYDYDQQGNVIKTNYNYEMWSFNAITSVLNGQKYIQDGAEANAPAPAFEEILPTEFTFRIDEFSNAGYTNITYSIYEYQQDGSGYTLFNSLDDVPATTELITVTGTNPYPYDYEIVIKYDLASGENGDTPFETSTWQYSVELVETVVATDTTATVTLVTADVARTFTTDSVQVFLAADDTEVTGSVTVTYDGATVTLSGLTAETDYYITFTTSDAYTDVYIVNYCYYANVVTEATPV